MPLCKDSEPSLRLLAAGTGQYKRPDVNDLQQVPDELSRIHATFELLGYRSNLEQATSTTDPDSDALLTLFDEFRKRCTEGDRVVAYYTGHGVRDEERFYLLTSNSETDGLHRTAVAAEDLARHLVKESKAEQILMIVDTCYAGAGAAEFMEVAHRLTRVLGDSGPELFVIAAARTREEADEGALSFALQAALAVHDERLGGRVQPYLAIEDVMESVKSFLEEKHPEQKSIWSASAVRGRCRLFPNPRYRQEVPPGLDLDAQRAFDEHWLPKARGIELGAGGWYFTGRDQALRELANWLGGDVTDNAPRVVTGGPGAGKSALLARIVTLSDPRYRNETLTSHDAALIDPSTLPPEGIVDVAVHVRNKLLAEVVGQIASGLGMPVDDANELLSAIHQQEFRRVIVVDALDEADARERADIVSQLLVPLARLPNVLLLIGSRPDQSDTTPGRRFGAFGDTTVEIDLDDLRYIEVNDIARYVERRLLASEEPNRETPYQSKPELARTVAKAVAARADGNFLVAHSAAQSLLLSPFVPDITDGSWIEWLPTGLDSAFNAFLSELDRHRPDGLTGKAVQRALLPLAFAEGEGLPWANIWSRVASAVSGVRVSNEAIALVRKHAGSFIVEASENDRSVYRLYHELVAEHLRRDSDDVIRVQRRIAEALVDTVPMTRDGAERDWSHSSPYVLSHLAKHAVDAGSLDELIQDGPFLAAAEPTRLRLALASSAEPLARRTYAPYSLAFHNLVSECDELNRLSYLEMSARKFDEIELANQWTRQSPHRQWSVPWVRWASLSSHLVLRANTTIRAISLGTVEGQSVIITGGDDKTVQLWDAQTGTPSGRPIYGHEDRVLSVTLGTIDGEPVIVSGGQDRTVRTWDVHTGTQRGKPIRGHDNWIRAVALGTLNAQPIIISGGDDATVRIWNARTKTQRGEPMRGHDGWICAVALGALDGQLVIVSGGLDGTVRTWDARTGRPRGEPMRVHNGKVFAIALGTVNGQSVIASGGDDGSVRIWDARTGTPLGEPIRGHDGKVFAIALGTVNGQSVIVSGGEDGTVRIWDARAGTPLGDPMRGHNDRVFAIALGSVAGRSVIVSGSQDKTVRLWDVHTGNPRGNPKHAHAGRVVAVSSGTVEKQSVIVTGDTDGTVRLWDAHTGTPRGKPMRGNKSAVYAVALGTVEGQSVIVTGDIDGTVRLWDARTGTPRGKPMHSRKRAVRAVALNTIERQPVIVCNYTDGTTRLWNAHTGKQNGKPMRGYESEAHVVALGTVEGQPVIVFGCTDGTVRMWNADTGKPRGEPMCGHEGNVKAVALGTVEGRSVIVSGGQDRTVRLWDAHTGILRGQPMQGHEKWVEAVALGTVEGRSVIISGGPGIVRLWSVSGARLISIDLDATVREFAVGESTVYALTEQGQMAIRVSACLLPP